MMKNINYFNIAEEFNCFLGQACLKLDGSPYILRGFKNATVTFLIIFQNTVESKIPLFR